MKFIFYFYINTLTLLLEHVRIAQRMTKKYFCKKIVIGGSKVIEKVYVGTFEFDEEEVRAIYNSLILYKTANILLNNMDNCEICDYLMLKMRDLKEEKF